MAYTLQLGECLLGLAESRLTAYLQLAKFPSKNILSTLDSVLTPALGRSTDF